MIIIAVLGALLIVLALTLQLANAAIFSEQYFYRLYAYQKAYYVSSSCLEGVLSLFSMDDAKTDSLAEPWAKILPPIEFKDGKIFILIEDENRKFNPNSMLAQDKKENEAAVSQFKNLLRLTDMRPNFANSVLDWMDEDSNRRIPGGAESVDYKNFPCKNAPLDGIEELLLLPKIEKQDFYGKIVYGKKIPGLTELLTAFGGGKININTASAIVLQSLDEKIDEKMAAQIILRREEKPFSSLNDLLDINGIDLNLIYRISGLSDIKSDAFKIIITVEYGADKFKFTNIVKRTGQNFKLVYRKAE